MLIKAHDEWQDSDRRYLSEQSMAQLNPAGPDPIQPRTLTDGQDLDAAADAHSMINCISEQHATSYTR